MKIKIECKKCGDIEIVKAGKVNGNQRYKCKACGCQFQPNRRKGRPESTKRFANLLYICGLSMRSISKIVKTDLHAVYRWIQKFAQENYEKPEPKSEAVIVELDEMWHFIKSKKQALDMEGLLPRYPSTYRLGVWRER
jgi:transposase